MTDSGTRCCVRRMSDRATDDRSAGTAIAPRSEPPPFRWRNLPGGDFRMGSDGPQSNPDDGEGPVRTVGVRAFTISVYAVTNAQFADFVRETGYRTDAERLNWSYVFHLSVPPDARRRIGRTPADTPWWLPVPRAYWAQPEGPGSTALDRRNHPVVHVSWHDAQAFCRWSGARLPTEAEWEYAGRGGLEGAAYPWGDDLTPGGQHHCNIWQGRFPEHDSAEDGYAGTAPVDAFPPNGFGLHNVVGNVWEWCADKFTWDGSAEDGSEEPACADRDTAHSLRGGSFLCHRSYCNRYRVAARSSNTARSSASNVGFRVVRNV